MTRAIKAASAATEAGALGAAGRRAPVMLARVAALAALAVMLARPGWLEPFSRRSPTTARPRSTGARAFSI